MKARHATCVEGWTLQPEAVTCGKLALMAKGESKAGMRYTKKKNLVRRRKTAYVKK